MNLSRRGFLGGMAAAATSYFFYGSGLWVPSKEVIVVNNAGMIWDVGTGNREDLLDIITNISPMKMLHLTGFEKVPKSSVIAHDWLVDNLK